MLRHSWFRALPLVLLAACAPATVTHVEGSEDAAESAASTGAFVVVSAEETLVIPVDPAAPIVRADGLWLLDATDGTVLRPPPTPESRGRPECRAAGSPNECTLEESVRLGDSLDATLDPACACFTGEETSHCDDDPFESLGFDAWEASTGVTFDELVEARHADDEEEYGGNESLEEDDEECSESSATVASLHAGTLYSEIFEHNGCGGLNLYGSFSTATELTADARTFGLRDADEVACAPDGAFVDGWAERSEEDDYLHRDGRWYVPEDADDDDYALDRCAGFASAEGEVVFHEGRYLLVVGADIDGTGSGARFSGRLRLGRETCTSADPCGSVAGFVAFEGLDADDVGLQHVYVANDGTAAIVRAERRLDVYRRDDAVPSRAVEFDDALIGIRFHADARRLVRAMELEARHLPDASAGDETCEPGAELVDGECRVSCEQDLDCRAFVGCESACVAGVCDDGDRECTEDHPCGVDAVCREGRCDDVTLAAADEDFEDARGGSGWGNRCIAHLRAGRLDEAQAACAEGLDASTRPATRGALLYNLGLIALRRGDGVSARLDYEASLRARPNATVEHALAALGGPIER